MNDVKEGKLCKTSSCWSNPAKIIGTLFIIIATVLTLFTLDGFGIFGLFMVGLVLLRKWSCACPCHNSACSSEGWSCGETVSGDVDEAQAKPTKKSTTKKAG